MVEFATASLWLSRSIELELYVCMCVCRVFFGWVGAPFKKHQPNSRSSDGVRPPAACLTGSGEPCGRDGHFETKWAGYRPPAAVRQRQGLPRDG